MNEKTLLADKDQYEAKANQLTAELGQCQARLNQLQTALVQVQGIQAYIRSKMELVKKAGKTEVNGQQEPVTVPARS